MVQEPPQTLFGQPEGKFWVGLEVLEALKSGSRGFLKITKIDKSILSRTGGIYHIFENST